MLEPPQLVFFLVTTPHDEPFPDSNNVGTYISVYVRERYMINFPW